MNYQMGQPQSICPRCGNSDQVHTVRELFDTMNSMMQRSGAAGQFGNSQFGQPGSGPPGAAGSPDDGDYDHYNVEGSNYYGQGGYNSQRRYGSGNDYDYGGGSFGDNVAEDIAGVVASAALGMVGRAFAKRMKQKFDEKVVPVLQQRQQQMQQQWQESQADQDAIAQRYPELRGCLKDNVIFLDGGQRSIPIKDIKMPFTLAQADEVVNRLR